MQNLETAPRLLIKNFKNMYDNPTCFSWYSVWNIVILQNMLNFRWRSSIRTARRLHCQCSIRRILWRTGKWWCYKWGLYFILLPFYLILCSLCIWIIPWHMKWTSYYKSLRDMDLHSKEIFFGKMFPSATFVLISSKL